MILMLSVTVNSIMPNVFMPSVFMPSVVMPSVFKLRVNVLNVVAPERENASWWLI